MAETDADDSEIRKDLCLVYAALTWVSCFAARYSDAMARADDEEARDALDRIRDRLGVLRDG